MSVDTDRKHDELQAIGKNAMSCLRDMVNALGCDYDRLEELTQSAANERRIEHGDLDTGEEDKEELEELDSLKEEAGECTDREEAEQRIHEDPLSVEVRSGWSSSSEEFQPEEFCILITTGGPAVRILGELDANNEPHRAWLQVQDWGTPWTDYYEPDTSELLLTYARCFVYQ